MKKRTLLFIGMLSLLGLSLRVAQPPVFTESANNRAMPTLAADSVKIDPETGLATDGQLMLVKAHCTGCHSPKLILQSHFTRDGWRQKIRWMQQTQKLWDLGEAEPAVLDYLAKHYGPVESTFDGRRLPLPNPQWHK